MLSRVASSIYWTARYLERAENVARFLAVNDDLTLSATSDNSNNHDSDNMWLPLIQTSGDYESFSEHYDQVDRESVIAFLSFDRFSTNSILSCVRLARENARSVRESISHDMWQAMNELYLDVLEASNVRDMQDAAIADFVDRVKSGCTLVQGVTSATLSRNEAWNWWRIGSMIERADKTSRILDVKYFFLLPSVRDVGGNRDRLQWISLLNSASALQMFQQTGWELEPSAVARFLLFDPRFPRSLLYCINVADDSLHVITGQRSGTYSNAAEQTLGKIRAELSYADIEHVIADGLHEYLDSLQQAFNHIDDLLNQQYFTLS